ncbi:MAG: MogA/MoaB family molybdenum cofactor biosynthesis protein [Eubacteriales bacterium]|nr:MogA/MoaB family molybdenum cofactor biosynthesis protein [Eubacteriales bacterium]
MKKILVLTVSDSASRGERVDVSGPLIAEILKQKAPELSTSIELRIVSDEIDEIKNALILAVDSEYFDLILTTGGTGASPRDFCPEATASVFDREMPGIAEFLRYIGGKHTPFAYLSRAKSGIRKQTLIVNFPGNPKAIRESLEPALPLFAHCLSMLASVKEHTS